MLVILLIHMEPWHQRWWCTM